MAAPHLVFLNFFNRRARQDSRVSNCVIGRNFVEIAQTAAEIRWYGHMTAVGVGKWAAHSKSKVSVTCLERWFVWRVHLSQRCWKPGTHSLLRLTAARWGFVTLCLPVVVCFGRRAASPNASWKGWMAPDYIHTLQISHNRRLLGSASPMLTSTFFVNGKRQFSTPYRIDTAQPITKNFVTGDYVGDPYGCAKLGAYPSTGGGLLGTLVKYNQNKCLKNCSCIVNGDGQRRF